MEKKHVPRKRTIHLISTDKTDGISQSSCPNEAILGNKCLEDSDIEEGELLQNSQVLRRIDNFKTKDLDASKPASNRILQPLRITTYVSRAHRLTSPKYNPNPAAGRRLC
jgi:hypothetical protein